MKERRIKIQSLVQLYEILPENERITTDILRQIILYGNKLNDVDNYLNHGTNKQIFYKIFKTYDEIDEMAIVKLLKEAVRIDQFK